MHPNNIAYQDQISYIQLESFKEFINIVITNDVTSKEGNLYRGQASPAWKLIPAFARDYNFNDPISYHLYYTRMYEIFNVFKSRLHSFSSQNYVGLDNIEIWKIGRHYGLKTPLLDWSFSPFVALFFALSSYLESPESEKTTIQNVVVYKLINRFKYDNIGYINCDPLTQSLYTTIGNDHLFECKELELISDHHQSNQRQVSQAGIFTYLNSQTEVDIVNYLFEINISQNKEFKAISAYLIPIDEIEFGLIALDKMNINYSVLYPDVEGAAKYANMKYRIESLAQFKGNINNLIANLNINDSQEKQKA